MAEVLIHSAAEAEYEAALEWYFKRSEMAADNFEAAFERALEAIQSNPQFYPLCDDRHRFCLLRRYPYLVIYRVDKDEIRMVAVAHSRRLPGYWSDRRFPDE